MRLSGARARSRVDVADIVTDLVGADLGKLSAYADSCRAPVPRQRPRNEPADHHVERVDERLWDRTGALTGRRWLQDRGDHGMLAATGVSRIRRSIPGSGTAAMI
jgi:hypothetical protein